MNLFKEGKLGEALVELALEVRQLKENNCRNEGLNWFDKFRKKYLI